MEPREGNAHDSKSVFKAVEKDRVVDGVEGSGKIEKYEKRCFTRIRCEKVIVCDADKSCFSAVVGAIGRLQRVEEVVAYEMIIGLT